MLLDRPGHDTRVDPEANDEALEVEQEVHGLEHLDCLLGLAAVEIYPDSQRFRLRTKWLKEAASGSQPLWKSLLVRVQECYNR